MKQLFKLSLLLLALLLPANAHAEFSFEVNGIYYYTYGNDINGYVATVTHKGEYPWEPSPNSYSGDVTIPATVPHNGTTIPVTVIGEWAFYECTSLTSIDIPNTVTDIGYKAFAYCEALTSIDIPNSVTTIGDMAFECCEALSYINIPNSVTTIYDYAFSYCSALTSINIGNSITSIYPNILFGCSSLVNIVVASDNPKYDSRSNCNAIIETASNSLIAGCKNTIIPNSVTTIGEVAFHECFSLTSIDIPSSVTEIGDAAFEECPALNDVYSYISDPSAITMGSSVFALYYTNNYDGRTLHVPAGSLEAYQADTRWSQYFGSIVEMEPEAVLAELIKLNVTTAGLNEGATLQLTATVLPEDCADKTVLWSSDNPSVATVDSNGLVTTHSVGTATITAMTNDGSNLSTTCTVTLLPVSIKGDVNGDSSISISDVSKLIDYLLSGAW